MKLIRFEEAAPADYPVLYTYDVDGNLAEEPLIIDRGIWDRLEQYTAFRWRERQAVWTVQGVGEWQPHITPLQNITVDLWDEDSLTWGATSLDATPIGGLKVPDDQVYRIKATVGDNAAAIPDVFVAAYERLAEYHAADTSPAGVATHSLRLGDGYEESVNRNPNYVGRAMQYSGAADLIRQYRRRYVAV
jgi:hypothetical protein